MPKVLRDRPQADYYADGNLVLALTVLDVDRRDRGFLWWDFVTYYTGLEDEYEVGLWVCWWMKYMKSLREQDPVEMAEYIKRYADKFIRKPKKLEDKLKGKLKGKRKQNDELLDKVLHSVLR